MDLRDTKGTGRQESTRLAAVADARYFMRRAFRIIDEEARRAGVDPLECQALVQLMGAPDRTLSVTQLSARLDVPRPLVSRLAKTLDERELARRSRSPSDARVTLVAATETGAVLVTGVDAAVQPRFRALREEFPEDVRRQALGIWADNFGVG
ncbi:MarR family winged helix-turn-helix transcriptional regulator [Streptomyces sp. NPDC051018]|uniref:MarR family winged helix-turn-helix transcriptional regulator n=1 Tax=Streptomyces sp. NPDC051018 TaxID=3365639 RepID=UPI0037AC41A6